MKFYLASSFARIEEMRGYRQEMLQMGIGVTSRWLDEEYRAVADTEFKKTLAEHDFFDVTSADGLLCFTHDAPTRGGWHVEFGMGMALRRLTKPRYRIAVVGEPQNVFHDMDGVLHFSDWPQAKIWLKGVERANRKMAEGIASGGGFGY